MLALLGLFRFLKSGEFVQVALCERWGRQDGDKVKRGIRGRSGVLRSINLIRRFVWVSTKLR